MVSKKLRHPLWVMGKPYYDLKSYYRNHLGERVYKVQIDAGFTCPNRDGSRGVGGCSYCDGRGSQLRQKGPLPSVREQLEEGKRLYKRLRQATRFVAYFQTCTNTYGELPKLRQLYEEALSVDEVVGLSVGTRPDAITGEVVEMLAGFCSDYDVWIEYGLQSMHSESLERINRGHSLEEFVGAVEMLSGSGIKLCVHAIIGLPWETREMVFQTADFVAHLPIDGVKIHSLLLLKGTPLYADFLGIIGGAVVSVSMMDISVLQYFEQTRGALNPTHFLLGLIKAGIYGALVALAGCLRGMQSGRSASAVGSATTSAVVTGIVWVIVACAITTVIYSVLGV